MKKLFRRWRPKVDSVVFKRKRTEKKKKAGEEAVDSDSPNSRRDRSRCGTLRGPGTCCEWQEAC